MAIAKPPCSPYSRPPDHQGRARPTPGIMRNHPTQRPFVSMRPYVVPLILAPCLFLYSLSIPAQLRGLCSARVLWLLGLTAFTAATFIHECRLIGRNLIRAVAISTATTIKLSRLSSIYLAQLAYSPLLLSKPTQRSTASTAVICWEGLDKSLRTACTAVYQSPLRVSGYLRAVPTTAQIFLLVVASIKALPLLVPIVAPPDADTPASPRVHPPLPPIFTPPDTDAFQLVKCLLALPPLPPIITPPDTDGLSHLKTPHWTFARNILAICCLANNGRISLQKHLDMTSLPRVSHPAVFHSSKTFVRLPQWPLHAPSYGAA